MAHPVNLCLDLNFPQPPFLFIFFPSDLSVGEYLPQAPASCSSLCSTGPGLGSSSSSCCDPLATCSCGTHTGHYLCLCPPGYYGKGIVDKRRDGKCKRKCNNCNTRAQCSAEEQCVALKTFSRMSLDLRPRLWPLAAVFASFGALQLAVKKFTRRSRGTELGKYGSTRALSREQCLSVLTTTVYLGHARNCTTHYT